MKNLKFPICFRQKSGLVFGYLKNGSALVVNPPTGDSYPFVMMQHWHSEYSTQEQYFEHIESLFESLQHEFISCDSFDETLHNTFDALFTMPDKDNYDVTIASVQAKRKMDFPFVNS